MPFMIAHGASVVIVRDGKRKTIAANGGANFTEEEIRTVNSAAPGSLRKPINEGRGVEDEADTDESGEDTGKVEAKKVPKNETAKQKKAREASEAADAKKAEKLAAKEAADKKAAEEAGDDDDAGENAGGDDDDDI